MPSSVLAYVLCAVPLSYLSAALLLQWFPAATRRIQFVFSAAAALAAVTALIAHALLMQNGSETWVSLAPVSLALLLLIALVGLVIAHYSENYLAGEMRENDYYQSLHGTLAAASAAVISNHMLVLIVAWVAISLNLHRLLMFYPNRPRAALAAHKKFLFARLAELSLLGAFVLLYLEHGSWRIDQVLSVYPKELSATEQWAAVLLVITALIKCAQLPIHGWLIQVVEAPTPVSALLHAGIINLGGYLLILFAPMLSQALWAQWLLLVVAGTTTLLAGLIMLTRVSVKVRLAWSTVAQMGLMLVECALGLYELALLHLIAHSCYKAYAFLNAGSAVESDMVRRMVPQPYPGLNRWLLAMGLAFALVAIPFGYFSFINPTMPLSPWLLLTALITLQLLRHKGETWYAGLGHALGIAVILVTAYSAQKAGAAWLVPHVDSAVGVLGDIYFGAIIVMLIGGHGLLVYKSNTAFGSRLWHLLYAGLYLDEWATRVTLAVWPIRIPASLQTKQVPLLKQESM